VYFRPTKNKIINSLEDHPINIPTKFGSNWPYGFRKEDQKQTTPFLTPLSLLFLLSTSDQQKRNINFLEDHPMNIPTKLGSNCPMVLDKIKKRQQRI